jgi:outer membrane protein
MAQYQAKVAMAAADLKIARSGQLPQVNFAAKQDWYNDHMTGLGENSNWYVGLTLSLNLLDSGLTESQVKQAKLGIDDAREQARKTRDSILLEVRQYYLGMREAEKRIDTSKVAGEQAKESLRIAELRYNAGVGTNIDVLDAVLALDTARNNIVQALYDYNTDRAQLFRAVGVAAK